MDTKTQPEEEPVGDSKPETDSDTALDQLLADTHEGVAAAVQKRLDRENDSADND